MNERDCELCHERDVEGVCLKCGKFVCRDCYINVVSLSGSDKLSIRMALDTNEEIRSFDPYCQGICINCMSKKQLIRRLRLHGFPPMQNEFVRHKLKYGKESDFGKDLVKV